MNKPHIQNGEPALDYQVKTLSEIGQEITSSLSVEKIIERTYKKVNSLMDASVFWIGLYNEKENRIDFPGPMEKGEKLPSHSIDLTDSNRHAVWCFKNQKEIVMNDIRNDYKKYFPDVELPPPTSGEETKSLIYLPLSSRDKKIGVITVQSFKKDAYTLYHLDILRNLTLFIITALENARLYEDVETKVKERTEEVIKQKEEIELSYKNIELLSEIGKQITSTHNFETIFEKLRESVNSLMDAECFGIRIYHPEKNEVEIKYEYDKNIRSEPFSFSFDNDNNFSVWCIKNKKEIFINDNIAEHKKYVKEIVVIQGEMTQSLIFCPMILNERVIGVITVQSYKKNQYSPYHLTFIRTLASYAAIALENASVYENIEAEIKQRTLEVIKQKEELEEKSKALQQSYHNITLLSEIGQQITSSLSVETIIETAYESVNQLMDASSFWIGIYNESAQRLDYPLGKENGKTISSAYYDLSDDKRLPVWSFKNKKEIMVNDYEKE